MWLSHVICILLTLYVSTVFGTSLPPQPVDLEPNSYYPYGCWAKFQGRPGGGIAVHSCPSGEWERSGLLCYPKCSDQYRGIGPICWRRRQQSKTGSNRTTSNTQSKLKLWYGRGVGRPLQCNSTAEDMLGGLCFRKCTDAYSEPVGYQCKRPCPLQMPFGCGLLCTKEKRFCVSAAAAITQKAITAMSGISRITQNTANTILQWGSKYDTVNALNAAQWTSSFIKQPLWLAIYLNQVAQCRY